MQLFQNVAIVGHPQVLMASKNDYVRPILTIEPNCFGLVLSKMNFVKASNPTLNIGHILSRCDHL